MLHWNKILRLEYIPNWFGVYKLKIGNINSLIMNFKDVTFMDSSGIGVVIGRFKKLQGRGGKVCVIEVNNRVDKVFKLSGLYKIINNYENLEEAIRCI